MQLKTLVALTAALFVVWGCKPRTPKPAPKSTVDKQASAVKTSAPKIPKKPPPDVTGKATEKDTTKMVELLVKAFWEALGKSDFDTAKEVSGFPMLWDSSCRIYASFEEMEKRVRARPPPRGGIKVGKIWEVSPDSAEVDRKYQRSLRRLSQEKARCRKKASELIKKTNEFERRYFAHEIIVGERTIGGTVTRVSLIKGEWKVTGLDN